MSIHDLVIACAAGDLEEVKKLVEVGEVSIHDWFEDVDTPIDTAIRYNNLEVVKYFLEKGAFPDGDMLHYTIMCSYGYNRDELIKFLIEVGFDFTGEWEALAQYAVKVFPESEDVSILKSLFENVSKLPIREERILVDSLLMWTFEHANDDKEFKKKHVEQLVPYLLCQGVEFGESWDQDSARRAPGYVEYIVSVKKITEILNSNGVHGSQMKRYLGNELCVNAVREGICDTFEGLKEIVPLKGLSPTGI